MKFRRIAQAATLAVFLLTLALSGLIAAPDLFLRMDPALTGSAALAGRILAWAFVPAVLVVVSALLFGRIFCGYICPMGTTLDVSDACLSGGKKKENASYRVLRRLKYYILAFAAGSAAAGVMFVFWAAPLSLITRFYGLVIYPALLLVAELAVSALYPLASFLDIRTLMFAEVPEPRYATQIFVLLFFVALFAASRISSRFWCRYICPSGALLAMASVKPAVRRRVGPECNSCGLCVKNCPMDAIYEDSPEHSRHSECIACLTCVRICPQKAVRFAYGPGENEQSRPGQVSQARRRFLAWGLAGAGTAAVSLTGLSVVAEDESEKGVVRPARMIRPPGAVPEPAFLAACVRCGQCMAACPTNTLQPIWFEAGLLAVFSPVVTPRRRYCDPECTVCGRVCPTGAITEISPRQRQWAKIGTAVIYRQKCLAWEYDKSCMVCDEVCPYGAVEFERRPGFTYPVPHVVEHRCSGCGHCEHACPVYNKAAIVVTPMESLRLEAGRSYQQEARSRGFDLRMEKKGGPAQAPRPSLQRQQAPEPGPEENGDLPPGFDQGGGGSSGAGGISADD
ncbi:MAG: 4Fe-4S binding protein [Desulfosalsimonas sp.]